MKTLNITINFDMDGTIADLYGVENWLEYLIAGDTFPTQTQSLCSTSQASLAS